MKDTMRSVNRGENFVKSALASGLLSVGVAAVAGTPVGLAGSFGVIATQQKVKGTKFKVKDKTDKERAKEAADRDQNNRLNANEILRYSGSKYKKDANKYIKNMSDSAIKKEAESWREAAESFKPGGEYEDAETVKEYIENAKYYERELARRNK